MRMSDHEDSAAHHPENEDDRLDRSIAGQPSIAPDRWIKRIVLVIVALAVGYVAYLLSAAFFPRWWARQIKDLCGGDMTPSVLWGLFFGFVFTVVPLLLIFQTRYRFFNWKGRIAVVVVAALIAAPNWLTLFIVTGGGKATHDAERILSDNAPGFRWASLWGAVLGALLAMFLTGSNIARKRRKHQVKRLRGERDELRRERDHDGIRRDRGTDDGSGR
ncbi:MAG: hypothetical protein JWP31_1717 [Aeromicrobium sp.]|nr:hypothetical protein [Aeromicrobium sp.]